MKSTRIPSAFVGLVLALAGTLAIAQDEEPPLPSDPGIAAALRLPHIAQPEVQKWRDFIRPTEDEASYQTVDWIPTFADGLRASAEQNKPLLFWAMNGHPLGCT